MNQAKNFTLWVCLFLFIGRVIGQVYVGIYADVKILSYLPTWEYWYSGLLPYPLLLISQILIIQVLTLMAYDFTRSDGFFFLESMIVKGAVRSFAVVYFLAMVTRYLWFDQTHIIPIIFHCILAVFLFIYSFPRPREALKR